MRRRLLLGLAVLAGMSTIGTLGFRSAGNWLVVDNELKSATAIVVLGGQVPFRAMEAVCIRAAGRTKCG